MTTAKPGSTQTFDLTVDVVIIGSGGGGLTAALTARESGNDTLVIEKCPVYGGSTAISGGGIWIPNNHLMAEAGIYDSFEMALKYLKTSVGDRVPEKKLENYLKYAPEMTKFLNDKASIKFRIVPNAADYYDLPGSITNGRGLDVEPFNGKLLKENLRTLRKNSRGRPPLMPVTTSEIIRITKYKTTGSGKKQMLKLVLDMTLSSLSGKKRLTMGRALIGSLRYAMMKMDVPLWLNTPAKGLIMEGGKVVGIEVEKDVQPFKIKARKGVILAAGGFSLNQQMRDQYLPKPTNWEWSVANDGDTGDAIRMGMEIGAAVDLMDDAWWMPTYIGEKQLSAPVVIERQLCGSIVVDQTGQRFVNEAIAYSNFGQAIYKRHLDGHSAIPCYYIFDQRSRDRYFFGPIRPGKSIPKEFYNTGEFAQANSIRELAQRIGINPDNLDKTVERYSGYARGMKDQEFQKGMAPFEHVYADPACWPNPCLAPIDQPPFYAIKMYPGDLGTKGGLVTDEIARVLKKDGSVIEGLFAAGNTSASSMGYSYPGAGATIGPSMVFGYIAAKYLNGSLK